MLPLRSNKKPQLVCLIIANIQYLYFLIILFTIICFLKVFSLIIVTNQLPIKQLLSKQKDGILRLEDDQNLNTDEYLLWKSQNESDGRKSVSFNIGNSETQQKHFKSEFSK